MQNPGQSWIFYKLVQTHLPWIKCDLDIWPSFNPNWYITKCVDYVLKAVIAVIFYIFNNNNRITNNSSTIRYYNRAYNSKWI